MGLINKEQEYQDQENWSDSIEKLKGYKEFVENVKWWAIDDAYISYEIVFDEKLGWCVDVDGDVNFSFLNISEIPVRFRNVSGCFWCSYCKNLTSLKNCPVYVGKVFDCRCTKLISLEGCPKEVGGDFWCNSCGKKFNIKYIKSLSDVKGDILN